MTPARIEKLAVGWRGFLVAREAPSMDGALYATRVRVPQGWLVEIAGDGDISAMAKRFLPAGDLVEATDAARGQLRAATLREGRLQAALYISRTGSLPSRDWLIEQLEAADGPSSVELLAGRPAKPREDRGPVVCVCFDVGMKTILAAITGQGLATVEAVGSALSAGTNCGSCRPAIQKLIATTKEVANG